MTPLPVVLSKLSGEPLPRALGARRPPADRRLLRSAPEVVRSIGAPLSPSNGGGCPIPQQTAFDPWHRQAVALGDGERQGTGCWPHHRETPTETATDIHTRRVPPLWVGFVVASLPALDVLDAAVWSVVRP